MTIFQAKLFELIKEMRSEKIADKLSHQDFFLMKILEFVLAVRWYYHCDDLHAHLQNFKMPVPPLVTGVLIQTAAGLNGPFEENSDE